MATDPSNSDVLALLKRRKQAVLGTAWVPRSNGSLELRAALTDGPIVIAGVSIFINCKRFRPDEQVTVGLTIEGARRPFCCARIDWRETTTHPNTNRLCGPYQFIDAGRTHYHNPELIESPSAFVEHLKENLPIAVAIDTQLKSFSDVMVCATRLLNVENLEEMSVPPWQQQAF